MSELQGMVREDGADGVMEGAERRCGGSGVDAVTAASGAPVSGSPDSRQENLTSEAIELVVAGLRGAVSVGGPLARVEGATWQAIGGAAGMTRQAAQSRWGAPAGPPQPQAGRGNAGEREPHLTPGAKGRRGGRRTHERVRLSLPGIPVAVTVDVVREQRPGRSRRKPGG